MVKKSESIACGSIYSSCWLRVYEQTDADEAKVCDREAGEGSQQEDGKDSEAEPKQAKKSVQQCDNHVNL